MTKGKRSIFHRAVMSVQAFFGLKKDLYNEEYNNTAVLLVLTVMLWIIGRFGFGLIVANDPSYCRMKSIGDFLIAPAYTVGCNIGKDRWDIRVN